MYHSPFFDTIHEDDYHTILRTVIWHDTHLEPLPHAMFHDFCVVWDEDHDSRVIPLIEKICAHGWIAPVLFCGEGQGHFVATMTPGVTGLGTFGPEYYAHAFDRLCQAGHYTGGDPWSSEITIFGHVGSIGDHDTLTRWQLGPKHILDPKIELGAGGEILDYPRPKTCAARI